MKRVFFILFLILFTSLFTSKYLYAEEALLLQPREIKVHILFMGEPLKVMADVSSCEEDFVLKISSSKKEESTFKTIEKVFGLIWMKVNDVHYKNLPYFYHLYSTKPVETLLSPEALTEYNLGFKVLGEKAEISPFKDPEKKRALWQEYLKYKGKYHLYLERTVPFQCENGKVQVVLNWPFEAPPDDYKIEFYEIKNGKVIGQKEGVLKVYQVGLVKMLADFSKNSPLLYGILAVLIALVSGFLIGLIFKKGGH